MSSRSRCERVRAKVRENFDFVPLKEAQFLWDLKSDGPHPWPAQSFVVVPHMIDGVDPCAFFCSAGADSEGWPTANYNNPAYVLGTLLVRDWTSEAERIEAIAEFAKIEELDWSRELLRGIARNVGAFQHDDEVSCWYPMENIEAVERFRDGVLDAMERRNLDEDDL